jgi:hypothetical protein
MSYFAKYPKVVTTQKDGTRSVMVNLLTRSSIIQTLLDNPLLFYSYDVQDGETPEMIAHRYYNDSYFYWLILYANQINDPQWGWPLDRASFERYIVDKYTTQNPYSTIHHYEKIITQFESSTRTTTVKNITIDEDTYNALAPSKTVYQFPTSTTTITISKAAITLYQYELNLNESKRNIKVIKKEFAETINSQFETLMSE